MINLSNLTIIIVTYKTDRQILENCLKSIDRNIKVKIIENSKTIDEQDKIFLSKRR